MQNFDLVAHRGYPKRFPDNSLAGIRAALAAGARFLEIDVQLSSDGTPWLFHDETLQRVCGVGGRLTDLSDKAIAELRASEAARLGQEFLNEPIARLDQVAAELEQHDDVFAFVEIKPVAVEAYGAEPVVAAVAAPLAQLEGRISIISFSIECLRVAADKTPFETGLILHTWDQLKSDYLDLDPDQVFCNVDKLPADNKVIELKAALAIYEIIEPKLALALAKRGAQYVETFAFPEMRDALELLSE